MGTFRALTFLALSLATHLILALFFHLVPPAGVPQNETVEIVVLTPPPEPQQAEKQFVRQTDKPNEESFRATDRIFLSKDQNRVRKSTKADRVGKTKNRLRSAKSKKPKTRDVDPLQQAIAQDLRQSAPSTVGEYLPDIEVGSITALNTDRFTFYSFFKRAEDLFRFRWESNLRRATQRIAGRPFRGEARTRWVTRLKVILDSGGRYKRSIIERSSGLKDFDDAAIRAFADAGYFPNPPSEMVHNNEIELEYQFVYIWSPRLWTRSPGS